MGIRVILWAGFIFQLLSTAWILLSERKVVRTRLERDEAERKVTRAQREASEAEFNHALHILGESMKQVADLAQEAICQGDARLAALEVATFGESPYGPNPQTPAPPEMFIPGNTLDGQPDPVFAAIFASTCWSCHAELRGGATQHAPECILVPSRVASVVQ